MLCFPQGNASKTCVGGAQTHQVKLLIYLLDPLKDFSKVLFSLFPLIFNYLRRIGSSENFPHPSFSKCSFRLLSCLSLRGIGRQRRRKELNKSLKVEFEEEEESWRDRGRYSCQTFCSQLDYLNHISFNKNRDVLIPLQVRMMSCCFFVFLICSLNQICLTSFVEFICSCVISTHLSRLDFSPHIFRQALIRHPSSTHTAARRFSDERLIHLILHQRRLPRL